MYSNLRLRLHLALMDLLSAIALRLEEPDRPGFASNLFHELSGWLSARARELPIP